MPARKIFGFEHSTSTAVDSGRSDLGYLRPSNVEENHFDKKRQKEKNILATIDSDKSACHHGLDHDHHHDIDTKVAPGGIPDICHESHEYSRVNFFWPV